MLRKLLTTVSCIALALAVPDAAAVDSAGSVTAKVEQQKQDQTAEKRKAITAEAMSAVSETRNALKALDDGQKDEALSALERAMGKLEVILAREPDLAFAPTNVDAVTITVNAEEDKIKGIRKEAQRLMDEGEVQAARHLLDGLASETVISVSNIPLGTYPTAIKEAARLVDNNKFTEAKRVLQAALNTQVITNTIIPLPVAETQELLKEAEKLAENVDRTPDENKRLDDLLTQAHTKLEFAQVLGYGTKQDFKDLYAQLDEIKGKTSSGKSGTGFFAKIKSSLAAMVKSGQHAQNQPTAPTPKAANDKTQTKGDNK
jgi:dGTP triphosphohydrolase